ncbi:MULTISPECIES: hypothetical protein [unclassified Streptomyces]
MTVTDAWNGQLGRQASMTDTLLLYESAEGVLLRAGVWVVGARLPL